MLVEFHEGHARTHEQFRAVLCQTSTWNYHICCFDDNVNIKRKFFIFFCIHFNGALRNPVLACFANIA